MARKKKAAPRRKKKQTYEESAFRVRMPAIVRERPLDSFGLFLAASVATAISVNALMLQDARKPLRISAPSVSTAPAQSNGNTPAATPAPAPATEATTMLVREVQSELARRGLYDGPADGIFGPKTEAAIFDFEMGAGLKLTGQPNPQLLTALRGNSFAPAASPRVAAVQEALNKVNFGPVKADGVLGEGTRAAIRRFEASRRLPQTGEISPAFLRALSQASGVTFN